MGAHRKQSGRVGQATSLTCPGGSRCGRCLRNGLQAVSRQQHHIGDEDGAVAHLEAAQDVGGVVHVQPAHNHLHQPLVRPQAHALGRCMAARTALQHCSIPQGKVLLKPFPQGDMLAGRAASRQRVCFIGSLMKVRIQSNMI